VDLAPHHAALAGIPILLGLVFSLRAIRDARLAPAFAVVLVAATLPSDRREHRRVRPGSCALPTSTILEWLFLIWSFAIIVRAHTF